MPRKLVPKAKEKVAISEYLSWKRLLRKMAKQASDAIAAGDFVTQAEMLAELKHRVAK